MQHKATPIYSALKSYMAENNLRLHMPGHSGGKGFKAEELRAVAAMDLSEVPGLDDLHLPLQAIKSARSLLADAFGAGQSLFLVNGATSGIHALFLSLLPGGTKVIVPRNAHRSFYGGMVLSGTSPVYLPCRLAPGLGVALANRSEDIFQILKQNPEVKGVFLTSPSYYGTSSELEKISLLLRENNKLLLVDEAHGGHFPFHPAYPRPALQSGADAVVNGLHKTLPVLNQGACLHLLAGFAEWEQVLAAWSLLTTTSPSYPILASIDLARQLMVKEGFSLLERACCLSQKYKSRINQIKGLHCFEEEELKALPGISGVDPLKVLISTQELIIDGLALAKLLRQNYQIQVELAAPGIILAMMSIFHEGDDWERLYRALEELAWDYRARAPVTLAEGEVPPLPYLILAPREAYMAAKKSLPLDECQGAIAGEIIAAYPPGIPCLLPGELIDDTMLDYLRYLKKSGLKLQGPQDPALNYVKIIE